MSRNFPPDLGGIENLVLGHARYLSKLGHKIVIITKFSKEKANIKQQNFKIYRFLYAPIYNKRLKYSYNSLKIVFKLFISLLKKLKQVPIKKYWTSLGIFFKLTLKEFIYWDIYLNQIDILHKKYNFDLFYFANVQLGKLGQILSKKYNRPFVIYVHGTEITKPIYDSDLKLLFIHESLKNANILSVNTYLKRIIKNFNENNKIYVLAPGIEIIEDYNNNIKYEIRKKLNLGLKKDDIIILSLSRLIFRKGIQDVVEVIPKIYNKNKKIKYLIVGDGKMYDFLKKRIEKFKAEKYIMLLGKKENKWDYYKASDIFIMPSFNFKGDIEGFGIVYLEANMCKIPVIGTYSGGIPDVVKNEINGLLVKPRDHKEIRNALLRLINDEEFRIRLGISGREFVIKNYEWNVICKKLENILKNLIILKD